MLSKPGIIVLVGALCVAAAGGGAYLAVRQGTATPAALSALPPDGPAPEASATPAAVPAPAASPSADTVVAVDEPAPAIVEKRTPEKPAAPRTSRRSAPVPQSARETYREPASAPVRQPDPLPAPAADPIVRPAIPATEPLREPVLTLEPEPAAPPARAFEELVVTSGSVIGLQIETSLTTERARVEDRVEARITRDVTVGDRAAIPAGARMIGSVSLVEKGGKVRERARLGVRFHTLVLADGTTLPVETETIYRDGESPAGQSAAKIGGAAVGGAILGAIFGGTKGAIIGGSTGAAGGTAAVMAGDRKAATLPAGSTVTVRLSAPVTVTVEREQEPRL